MVIGMDASLKDRLEEAMAKAEIEKLRDLIGEVGSGDWTDAAYALELPSRLAESGWFKRARAALTS